MSNINIKNFAKAMKDNSGYLSTGDSSLHHVYIQAKKLPAPTSGEILNIPIPDGFLENIAETSKNYPDIPITIWVDFYGIGNHSDETMAQLNEQSPTGNVTFRALDEIELYRTHPIFKKTHTRFDDIDSPIWQQIDLAKAVILKESLEDERQPEHALCFDIDVSLTEEVFKILDRQGIATSTNYSNPNDPIEYRIENRAFGMERDFLPFLNQELIPKMIKQIEEYHSNGWRGHVKAFIESDFLQNDIGVNLEKILFLPARFENDAKIKAEHQQDPPIDPQEQRLKDTLRAAAQESDGIDLSAIEKAIQDLNNYEETKKPPSTNTKPPTKKDGPI